MSETLSESAVLELSSAERAERDIPPDAVRDALVAAIQTGSREEKVFEDCTFPSMALDYRNVEGIDNYPVVFRNCTFEGELSVENADFALPLVFEDCHIASLNFYHARFEYDVEFHGSTIAGPVVADETWFEQDAEFDGVTFQSEVEMHETTFGDDTSFADAVFESTAAFQRAEFSGTSNRFDDNVSFENAVFEDEVAFEQARFGANAFAGAVFEDRVTFAEAVFDGNTDFAGVTFAGVADFAEMECHADADFEGVTFEGDADFEGVLFTGGARALEDDTRFVDAVFEADTTFRDGKFRYCNFGDARFDGDATFTSVRFDDDADFDGATVAGTAGFEETRFGADADFSGCRFESRALFGGAEFEGDAKQLKDDASFDDAVFGDDADFSDTEFTSATLVRTGFAGSVDFTGAVFSDRVDMLVLASGDEKYVDFTDAIIRGGTITQPSDGWVRYDLTRASLGDLHLGVEETEAGEELLDFFRFCETVFDEFDGNEFDFSAHVGYLDRNGWNIHSFEDTTDRTYAVEMTPEATEITYLKAKHAASAAGEMKAAGEFRTKRQQFARKKHLDIALDGTASTASRVKNGVRAAENAFLGVTCGHGIRIFRIFGVFAVAPALFAPFYAFGGKAFATSVGQTSLSALATPEGQATFFKLLSFSYITFLTIGYGNIGPQGWAARIFVALEVYASVILGGLVLYALIKRSEM